MADYRKTQRQGHLALRTVIWFNFIIFILAEVLCESGKLNNVYLLSKITCLIYASVLL